MPAPPAPSAEASEIFAAGLMKDKVLFVTGGGSGIGLGICMSFAKLGAKVAICGRTESKLVEACKTIKDNGAAEVMHCVADVRKPDECVAAVDLVGKKWGKIDVFVNNAAGNFMSLVEDTSSNAFNTVIDIDLRGCFNMAKAGLPWLREAAKDGAGACLLQTSATLHYRASPFQGHAAAAKAGIDSLTKTLASEWADDGIRVVSIAPGPIAGTEGGPTGRVFGQMAGKMDVRATCPLGRYGSVDDIGNLAVFLASRAGTFITGECIVVDGLQWQMTGAAAIVGVKGKMQQKMREQRDGHKRGTGSKGFDGGKQSKL